MKQLYKIITFTFLSILLFSCINEDEDVLSTQDLLIGKWEILEMKIDGEVEVLTTCELMGIMEFSTTEVSFTDYEYDDETSSCIFEEEFSFPYSFVDDNEIKVDRGDSLIIDTEIIELNSTTLILKSFVNGGAVEKTYKRIN